MDGVKERRKVFCFAFHNNEGGYKQKEETRKGKSVLIL